MAPALKDDDKQKSKQRPGTQSTQGRPRVPNDMADVAACNSIELALSTYCQSHTRIAANASGQNMYFTLA